MNYPQPPRSVAFTIEPSPGAAAGTRAVQAHFHVSSPIAHPLPPGLAAADASRVRAALCRLLPYEGALLTWMSQSPANARQFAADPFAAARAAGVALPDDLVAELRALSALVLKTCRR